MWRGIDVSGPYPSMKGYLICTLFAWFNPGLPNFANPFLRAVFTNQGVYILPKVFIANMADFGNVTIFHFQKFCIAAKMYWSVTQLHGTPDYLWYIFFINCALCSLETLN